MKTPSLLIAVLLCGFGSETLHAQTPIANWHELNQIRGALSGDYVLVNDLTEASDGYAEVAGPEANGGRGFHPIGDRNRPFSGTLDGNGHVIYALVVSRGDENDVGLFAASASNALITNVRLIEATVTGRQSVGGLIGHHQGMLTRSSVSGHINGQSRQVGGLVGQNRGGTILQSHADVMVSGGSGVGGLVGQSVEGSIQYAYAHGIVNGNNEVGGLVGHTIDSSVKRSYATAEVRGRSTNIGGLVGLNASSVITQTYATGNVQGQFNVGGLVGQNGDSVGQVQESYATGHVHGRLDVGGLVGLNRGFSFTLHSFWNVRTSGQSDSAGQATALTTAEMRTATPFVAAGWDFSDAGVWQIKQPEQGFISYPYFRAIDYDAPSSGRFTNPIPGVIRLFGGGFGGGFSTPSEPAAVPPPEAVPIHNLGWLTLLALLTLALAVGHERLAAYRHQPQQDH